MITITFFRNHLKISFESAGEKLCISVIFDFFRVDEELSFEFEILQNGQDRVQPPNSRLQQTRGN